MQKNADSGFSLVEVLVSLLILSIGVIGAASMQLTALQSNQLAGFHGIALQLAAEVAEQLRSLAENGIADADNPFLLLDFTSGDSLASATTDCFASVPGCAALASTAFSVREVESRLATMLPQGRIKVCRDAMPWNDSSGGYAWDCRPGVDSAAPIVIKLGWREHVGGKSSGTRPAARPLLILSVAS